MATVLMIGSRHFMSHNWAHHSEHTLLFPKKFPTGRYSLDRFWPPFEALGTWKPLATSYDLIHGFKAIPYTQRPFVVSFELFLPHIYASHQGAAAQTLDRLLCHRLTLPNCRKIIASSEYARDRFLKRWAESDRPLSIADKLTVIPANAPLQVSVPKTLSPAQPQLKLLFVGHHLARKGGVVALRLARKLLKEKLPITIEIVSDLKMGAGIPTDFPDRQRYAADLELLSLENIVFSERLPNAEVLKKFQACHFQLLPTLQDICAYSIIEGLATATPAIATNIGAVPEWIEHEKTGYILPLPVDENQMWRDWQSRKTLPPADYWEVLNATYDRLADQAFETLATLWNRVDRDAVYASLSRNALERARSHHGAEVASRRLDAVYAEALAPAGAREPVLAGDR